MKNNITKFSIKSYSHPYFNRKGIYKENKGLSGIYCWLNLINGKLYVGSAKNITKRLYQYFSSRHIKYILSKSESIIFKSMLLHGYDNFEFHILTYCNCDELVDLEQHYIDTLKPEYNLRKTVYSPLGYKHTPETILKLKTYKRSEETLKKMRLAKQLSGNTILIINILNNNIRKYPSLNSAARDLNVNKQMLHYCMKKNILLKDTFLNIKFLKLEF